MKVDVHLTKEEKDRYSRHLALPDFTTEHQEKLKAARVLVVGAGGLGCPVLQYLCAAGVGTLGIVDGDKVSLSNLQRQILYQESDIGFSKVRVAADRLKKMNHLLAVEIFENHLTRENALGICTSYDLIVDCSDNFPTRYLVNDVCVLQQKPFVYGSVFRYEGQVSVFNYQLGPTYRDLYPLPPAAGSVLSCAEGGVLGVLPGFIGCAQAMEAIKIITGIGEVLSGRLLIMDTQTMQADFISIPNQNQRINVTGLIDYEHFCNPIVTTKTMKEVTVQELKSLIDSKADFQLIDVREPHEYDICNLQGELIPQAEIPHNVDKISKDKKVIIHCRSGARSGNMVQWLEKNHGFTNLYNLKGGVLAWAKEIDPSMPTY